jgi:hypothetical protein
MYLKKEIIDNLNSPIYFTKYTIDSPLVRAWLYDTVEQKPIYELEKTPNITLNLKENQYSVDWKNNRIYFAPNLIGTPIYLEYYSYGEINPFHETSNILKFVRTVLSWTNFKINSGLYFYRYPNDTDNIWRLSHGSVIYNSNLYVVNEIIYDFRDYAPPTQRGYYKCYYFYINQDILDSFQDKQTKTLNKVGLVISDMFEDLGTAKLNALSKYQNKHTTPQEVIQIAFVYVTLSGKHFEYWIEYPKEYRTLV